MSADSERMHFAAITSGKTVRSRVGRGFRILETSHANGQYLPPHEHDDVSIDIIVHGSTKERVNNQLFSRAVGSLLVKPAYVRHVNSYGACGATSIVLQCSLTSSMLAEWRGCRLDRPLHIEGQRALDVGRLLRATLYNADTDFPIDAEVTVSSALSALFGDANESIGSSRRLAMARAREMLLDETHGHSLSLVAQASSLTPSAFTHAFRRHFGCTPSAMLRRYRLERSVRLLQDRRISISRVAAETGFADHAHFTRWFTLYYGLNPAAFRRSAGFNSVQDAT